MQLNSFNKSSEFKFISKMTPEELENIKEEMKKVFIEEFKKVNFKKIIEDVCKEVIKKEGMIWG